MNKMYIKKSKRPKRPLALLVALLLTSFMLSLLPALPVTAAWYFDTPSGRMGPFGSVNEALDAYKMAQLEFSQDEISKPYELEEPDQPDPDTETPTRFTWPTEAETVGICNVYYELKTTDGATLATGYHSLTPGTYGLTFLITEAVASGYTLGYNLAPGRNQSSYHFPEPGDYYITVYFEAPQVPVETTGVWTTQPAPTLPTTPSQPSPSKQPSTPPTSPPTSRPTQPVDPDWEDIDWDDDFEDDWDWQDSEDDNDEENVMLIHLYDPINGEEVGESLVIKGIPTGEAVFSEDIAPDIPGYMVDIDQTLEKFIQKRGLYEDAIYYIPSPFGYEWFDDENPDGDDEFDFPFGPDDKGECPGDPMCPDYPGNPGDPADPQGIPDPPTNPCPCKKGGTVCEQAGIGEWLLLETHEFKALQGKRIPIPAIKITQKTLDKQFAAKQKWDASYDVIVYGFDMAGAIAALTVAEEGGRVIILDKAPMREVGSYTPYIQQEFIYAKDKVNFLKFMEAWYEGYDHVDPAILKTYAQAAEYVPAWFSERGAAKLYRLPGVTYGELEGSDAAGTFRLSKDMSFDQAAWKLILKAMKPYVRTNIFLLTEARVTELVQDPSSGTVLGVKVHLNKKNTDVRLQAKGGVILAGGGFENNESMIENFLQMPEARAKFTRHNDGDTIHLAMRAGADLWHMDNVLGYELHMASVDKQYQLRNPLQGIKKYQLGGRSCFVVGPNGRRFSDEGALVRQGHIYRTGEWRAQEIPSQAWAILDHKGLTQAPLAQNWSKDNLAEVNAGKIFKANSLAELAQLIKVDPQDLQTQFADYQEACLQGVDVQFGRRPQNLFALDENGPYYAIPLQPVLEATLGGPLRNEACQLVDTQGEIIPNLYSAGSLGSWLANIFPQGADLTEAVITGQIAAVNALKGHKSK